MSSTLLPRARVDSQRIVEVHRDDWQAKPGTYVFKPPGETHTLVVDDGCYESVPHTSADHAIAAASMSFTEASFSSMWCELLMALDNTRSSFSSDMQRGLPVCCKPSDQPRDAARREECSNRMKRVFLLFIVVTGGRKGFAREHQNGFYET